MSIFTTLFGGSAVAPIKAIGDVIDSLFTSDDERAQAAAVMEKLRQHPGELQNAVNLAQAGHRSIFVAGARPFILWVCGFGLFFTFLVNPILQWLTGDPGPTLPNDIIMELVLGILGLGTLRTVEKLQGVSK